MAEEDIQEAHMAEEKKNEQVCQECEPEKVYVLEGDPNNVFDAQGNRIELTPEQKEIIEEQI